MRKISIIILLTLIIFIVSGCVEENVSIQEKIPVKKSTVTVIKSESLFGVGYDNYKVIHDSELNQTCTMYLYSSGAGVSCTPDSQLYESGYYGK